MCQRMMTRYFFQKVETDTTGRTCYAIEIRQTVSWLLKEHGYEAEAKRLEYTEALCTAAATILGSFSLLQLMTVEPGPPPVCSPNHSSYCALTALAYLGDISRLKTLINAGVDVNAGSRVMGKPLQAAAARGHTEIAEILLESGADANSGDSRSRNTALQLACLAGHERIVRVLLSPKYGILLSGLNYENAVLNSARGGHVDLMQFLLEFGGKKLFHRVRDKILHEASTYGAVNVVRALLDEGVDTNSRDIEWITPIQKAASRGYGETVQLLIARGADYGAGRSSPIYQAAKRGYERVVQILLDAGDDIHREGEGGPLTAAVKNEKIQMVQYLLRKGINPRNKSAESALILAAGEGYERIVRMLAAHEVDVDSDGHRPMLSALMFGHENVVKTLLEFGARPINVSECPYAAKFASGEYPLRRTFRY